MASDFSLLNEICVGKFAPMSLDEFTFINKETKAIESELAWVKAALEDARERVNNISSEQFDQIKRLRSPPNIIKRAFRCVMTLMGHKWNCWYDTRKKIDCKNFIQRILKFETDEARNMPPQIRNKIQKKWLADEDFMHTIKKRNKVRNVSGTLMKWVVAYTKFYDCLISIEPRMQMIAQVKNAMLVAGFARDCFKERKMDSVPQEIINLIFMKLCRDEHYKKYLRDIVHLKKFNAHTLIDS